MKMTSKLTIAVGTIPLRGPLQTLGFAVLLCLGIPLFSQVAQGSTYTFGSNNDGLAGFTTSTVETDITWATNADNVQYNSNVNGLRNSSLLREFILDRSNGNSYTITGTLLWTAEADRNNRVGIYLFGDNLDLTTLPGEDEIGAIAFMFNSDQNSLFARVGIDTTTVLDSSPLANAPATNSVFTDVALTWRAQLDFFNNGGTDQIDLTFSLIDNFGASPDTTILQATVDAAAYTGNYFGFAGRMRDDGASDVIVSYQSFEITPDPIPEPTTVGLLAAMGGALLLVRRRPGLR